MEYSTSTICAAVENYLEQKLSFSLAWACEKSVYPTNCLGVRKTAFLSLIHGLQSEDIIYVGLLLQVIQDFELSVLDNFDLWLSKDFQFESDLIEKCLHFAFGLNSRGVHLPEAVLLTLQRLFERTKADQFSPEISIIDAQETEDEMGSISSASEASDGKMNNTTQCHGEDSTTDSELSFLIDDRSDILYQPILNCYRPTSTILNLKLLGKKQEKNIKKIQVSRNTKNKCKVDFWTVNEIESLIFKRSETKISASMINTLDKNKNTPLHVAVNEGRLDIVKILIDAGAGLEIQSSELLVTPVLLACEKGYVEILDVLNRAGAFLEAKDRCGNNALHWAAANGKDDVIDWLIARNFDVNKTGYKKRTPLHNAAFKGHLSTVRLLVERGALPDRLDADKMSPKCWALREGNALIAEFLESVVTKSF